MKRAIWVLLCLAAAASAQQTTAPVQTPFVFRATVGDVLVQANVLDKHGRAINDLPESDFTVYDNGVKQTIRSFSHGDVPVAVGILVDNSGSMETKRIAVDRAALNFVRASNPQDEVFIVKFNDLFRMVAPFTSSIPALEKGLGSINPEASTALYDTIIRSIAYMNRNATRPKRAILLITDGMDDASSHDLKQTLRIIQSENAPMIYCIGLFDRDDSKYARKEGEKELIEFSDLTGGATYFPKNLAQVDAITRAVARDIRLQYNFIYHPAQSTPGYHEIKVVVRDRHQKNLKVHTKRGYYLGNGQ